jgi:hypothetical protein
MIKELDKLREIGAQKIYEDTHIPLAYVQSVIHESFEGLTKVQFLGFVSILEREYKQNLSTLKEKGLEYFATELLNESEKPSVFVSPKKKMKFTGLYIFVALAIFVFVAYDNFYLNSEKNAPNHLDNSAINSAKKNMNPDADEGAQNIDQNLSDANSTVEYVEDMNESSIEAELFEERAPVVRELAPLAIVPRSKLWIGYINKTDNLKKQKVITKRLELDSSKVWLLSLGHGYVDIEANSKTFNYQAPDNIRFLYKDGKLQSLSVKEFKDLNDGRLW